MIKRILLPLGCVLALAACAAEPPPEPVETTEAPEATAPPSGPTFLALHLYNPASDEAHQQFLTVLDELNQAVASAGHPETRYGVWKVTGEQAGEHSHLFGSLWADRATYDAVHEHADYKAVFAKFEESGLEPFEAEVYNRYTAVNPAGSGPMPEGGLTFLSVHVFNLASAEAETQLVGMLNEFNEAVTAAGHPETRYRVWKVTGEQTGEHAYVFGSGWADRATYDAVHEHADYKALQEKHREAYERLMGEQVYNHYERIQ
jgi:quinol monooxygenase YgiN